KTGASRCLRGHPVREWFTRIAWRRYCFNRLNRVRMGPVALGILVFPSFAQRLMDQGDRNRPVADCRRHTLETASADVADRAPPADSFQGDKGPGRAANSPWPNRPATDLAPF